MVNEINGHAVSWRGCVCEGDQMHLPDQGTFNLWMRFQQLDAPAGTARELAPADQITCEVCRRFLD
jgi:hypothetical protein